MRTAEPAVTSERPDVSVVVPVRDAVRDIEVTLSTLLGQQGPTLEVVAVDDGSGDGTLDVLRRLAAADPRLRVVAQAASGITAALIAGCGAARGRLIARQDAGGTSALPGRLARPAALLDASPEVVLASCGVRWLTPGGETLDDEIQDAADADAGLRRLDVRTIRGPTHHASTMFRRSDYEAVGGYRAVFRFAQDLDLWLRLAERGRHVVVPEVLTVRTLRASGTSAWMARWQRDLAEQAIQAAHLRAAGHDEQPALDAAAAISARVPRRPTRSQRAQASYHVGCRLRRRYPREARVHFSEAWRLAPWDVRPLIRLWSTR
ncbi:MAG: glycosyltransferase [Planctomycetes bacterium]|nr:glycosyltransferase [Planctomycetota bacterium]